MPSCPAGFAKFLAPPERYALLTIGKENYMAAKFYRNFLISIGFPYTFLGTITIMELCYVVDFHR